MTTLSIPGKLAYPQTAAHRLSPGGLLAIIAAHAAVIALLVSVKVLPLTAPVSALMVQLITPEAPAPVLPTPQVVPTPPKAMPIKPATPVKPKPIARKPVAAPKPAPAPVIQPLLAAPAKAMPPSDTHAPSTEAPPPAPASPSETPTSTPVASVSEARFDADYLQNPAPIYPALARRMGEEGKVILRVFVEASGRPSQIDVKSGSGSARLDQSALDAVRRWKFVPARRGTEPVGAWVLVPIVFNLRN